MNNGRLLLDAAAAGAWNMAVDQALLETADRSGLATLRFYGWTPPTLSLGYFQRSADRGQHPPSLGCQIVRRASGGGAIVHDREITYSLCLPSSNRWSSKNSELYELVHRVIIGQLQALQLEARLFRQDETMPQSTETDTDAFLCFQRRAESDILIGPHKVGGSAQRRLRNSLIQHGSLLLSRSDCAPELAGINDLGDHVLDPARFCREMKGRLSQELEIDFRIGQMSKTEIELAELLATSRFGAQNWTAKR
jgi:lipoate-protein ligase A